MTYSNSFNLLFMFLAHVLGDFYLQTNSIAEKKRTNLKILLLHCTIYGLCFTAFVSITSSGYMKILFFTVLFSLQHLTIDLSKFHLFTKQNSLISKYPNLDRWCKGHPLIFFVSDQMMHLFVISIICIYYANDFEIQHKFISFFQLYLAPVVTTFFKGSVELMLRWVLLFLVLWRPLSIFIELFLKRIPTTPILASSSSPQNFPNSAHTGRIIGTLERLLIAFLFLLQIYEGIGLVLAAKTLTRFNNLDHQDFAEYYLIGTMLSTLLSLLLSFLICT